MNSNAKEQKKAKAIIKAREQIITSEKDSEIFFDAITQVKKPSETLKNALKDYNTFRKISQQQNTLQSF